MSYSRVGDFGVIVHILIKKNVNLNKRRVQVGLREGNYTFL